MGILPVNHNHPGGTSGTLFPTTGRMPMLR